MSAALRHTHAPLLLVALLAAYGSLYPFRIESPRSFALALSALLAQSHLWTSRGDVAGNVLLFVPIGIAIVYATRGCGMIGARRLLYFAAACVFALLLQIAQLFVPARIAALSDALWNGVGTGIGMALGQAVLSRLPRWSMHGDRYTTLVLLALACWLAARLWPFEPALSVPQVYRTLKPLLKLDALNVWSVSLTAVSLMLIAGMVEGLRFPQRWLIGAAAAGLGVRFVLAGQAISTSIFLGTVIGFAAGLIVLRVGLKRAGPWVIVAALAWYSAEALRPFVFSARPTSMQWVPFAALLRGAMDINLASFCGVSFWTGALLLIMTRLYAAPARWALLLSVWILLLEWLQQWIPTRTSDITMAFLPWGWWLALRSFAAAPSRMHDVP